MNNMNWNDPYWNRTNPMPWNNYGSTPTPIVPAQPNTNKIYVTSLEDALNRSSSRGSEMVYFHQDANEFYVVKTDMDGRKSWVGFQYVIPNQDANTPATKADINSLIERIEKLENKGEVKVDAQSNG